MKKKETQKGNPKKEEGEGEGEEKEKEETSLEKMMSLQDKRIELLELSVNQHRTSVREMSNDLMFLTSLTKSISSKGMVLDSEKKRVDSVIENKNDRLIDSELSQKRSHLVSQQKELEDELYGLSLSSLSSSNEFLKGSSLGPLLDFSMEHGTTPSPSSTSSSSSSPSPTPTPTPTTLSQQQGPNCSRDQINSEWWPSTANELSLDFQQQGSASNISSKKVPHGTEVCQNCQQFFDPSSSNLTCQYHPGIFIPNNSETAQAGWSCCGKEQERRGCLSATHTSVPSFASHLKPLHSMESGDAPLRLPLS